MICCSRFPSRLICSSMYCTSRVAHGMLPVDWQQSGNPMRTLDFWSLSQSVHPRGQIYEKPLTKCEIP